MRCKKCGTGLTAQADGSFRCTTCGAEYPLEALKVKTLDNFIPKGDK